MRKNITDKIYKALKDFEQTVWVYLKSSNELGDKYDPYRNTGQTKLYQSPIPVKVIIHQLSSEGLIVKELGLITTGAIEVSANDKDIELIKNASKLKYKDKFYVTYHSALGSRVLISDSKFGRKTITCFAEGN